MNDALCDTGRHGGITLAFREKAGKTLLADAYATAPMSFLPPLYPDDTGCACTYLVNPTGGLVAGDRIRTDVTLDEKAWVLLTTPSATRVYRSAGGDFASQALCATLGEGAVLEYLPGYVIPFAGSVFRQTTKIRMERNAAVFILDSFVTGRLAMGERLDFREYHNTLEVLYDGTPLLFQRTALKPGEADYDRLGFLESFPVSLSLYLIFDRDDILQQLVDELRGAIENMEGVKGGVSVLWSKGLSVQLLGTAVQAMEKALLAIWTMARRNILGCTTLFPPSRLTLASPFTKHEGPPPLRSLEGACD